MPRERSKRKMEINDGVRFDAYEVISRAVEAGVAYGWNRAHKHGEPEALSAREAIYSAVMGELCDVLKFTEPGDPE